MHIQCGQGAWRFLARLGHGEGACQLRGWAGELRSAAAGSQRDQAVPIGVEKWSVVWYIAVEVLLIVPWCLSFNNGTG